MKRKIAFFVTLMVLFSAVMASCNLHEATLVGTWHSETKNNVRTVLVLKANKTAEYYLENIKTGEKTKIAGSQSWGSFADINFTWEANDTVLTINMEMRITGMDEAVKSKVSSGDYDLSGITLTWNGVKFSRIG